MKKRKYPVKTLAVLTAVIVFDIPFIINESYLKNDGYFTLWNANDVLVFYGTLLAFSGTVILGLVSFKQNNKANSLAERMLDVEEQKMYPYIKCVAIYQEKKQPISKQQLPNLRDQNICLNSSTSRISGLQWYSIPLYYLSEEDVDGERCSSLFFEIKNVISSVIHYLEFVSIDTNLMIENEECAQSKSFKFDNINKSKTIAIYPDTALGFELKINSNYHSLIEWLYVAPTKFEVNIIAHTVKKLYPQKIIIDTTLGTINVDYKFE